MKSPQSIEISNACKNSFEFSLFQITRALIICYTAEEKGWSVLLRPQTYFALFASLTTLVFSVSFHPGVHSLVLHLPCFQLLHSLSLLTSLSLLCTYHIVHYAPWQNVLVHQLLDFWLYFSPAWTPLAKVL